MAITTAPNPKKLAYTRLWIRSLLYRRELPSSHVTVMHRDIFVRAGLEWVDGSRMDDFLGSLNQEQLRRLAAELKGDEEAQNT